MVRLAAKFDSNDVSCGKAITPLSKVLFRCQYEGTAALELGDNQCLPIRSRTRGRSLLTILLSKIVARPLQNKPYLAPSMGTEM